MINPIKLIVGRFLNKEEGLSFQEVRVGDHILITIEGREVVAQKLSDSSIIYRTVDDCIVTYKLDNLFQGKVKRTAEKV